MIVLGLDPGYHRCGYGIIEQQGQGAHVVEYGCIETSSSLPFPDRLMLLQSDIERLVRTFKPEKAGVEELFFAKNTTTALGVAHARGVLLATLARYRLPIVELKPNQVKQALTGHGAADKRQMQQMVKMLLKLKEIPKPDDAADALAIALAAATWFSLPKA